MEDDKKIDRTCTTRYAIYTICRRIARLEELGEVIRVGGTNSTGWTRCRNTATS
ncbi:MAG: hypothetical protein ACLUEQ_13505 [Cloacibacillus evryensis]